ncbi:hypothetical protein F5J12DRAFT_950127 [Pisolithus orientalis]|uniref:uncharacterized protein n=1 Tax=Pisolithus orientalis TaxID=936130 RepID=UPI002224560A|nr:uncharacterized protein F5J12DRAFT_950127 [Pisolithus orientalis]KAI6001009.1 hypothetical protein F5J12DRAFT_950127 [Pisolithus orientalis]
MPGDLRLAATICNRARVTLLFCLDLLEGGCICKPANPSRSCCGNKQCSDGVKPASASEQALVRVYQSLLRVSAGDRTTTRNEEIPPEQQGPDGRSHSRSDAHNFEASGCTDARRHPWNCETVPLHHDRVMEWLASENLGQWRQKCKPYENERLHGRPSLSPLPPRVSAGNVARPTGPIAMMWSANVFATFKNTIEVTEVNWNVAPVAKTSTDI